MHVCVCVCVFLCACFHFTAHHHVCLIITPQSLLVTFSLLLYTHLPLSLPLCLSIPLSLLVKEVELGTKHTVIQRECVSRHSGPNSHHNQMWLLSIPPSRLNSPYRTPLSPRNVLPPISQLSLHRVQRQFPFLSF